MVLTPDAKPASEHAVPASFPSICTSKDLVSNPAPAWNSAGPECHGGLSPSFNQQSGHLPIPYRDRCPGRKTPDWNRHATPPAQLRPERRQPKPPLESGRPRAHASPLPPERAPPASSAAGGPRPSQELSRPGLARREPPPCTRRGKPENSEAGASGSELPLAAASARTSGPRLPSASGRAGPDHPGRSFTSQETESTTRGGWQSRTTF